MSSVTKPLALDETLQDVADAIPAPQQGAPGADGDDGKTAYESAVSGGYTMPESQFNADLEGQRWFTRKNLLDNWYFVGGGDQQGGGQFPVNQKKRTSNTIGTSGAYFIDRWVGYRGTFSLTDSSLKLQWDGTGGSVRLDQKIEYIYNLIGKKVTASYLLSDNSLRYATVTANETNQQVNVASAEAMGFNFDVAWNKPARPLQLFFAKDVEIVAVKLELGDTQTLAHLENGVWVLNELPDYETQLLRCQRFYRVNCTSGISTVYGISNYAVDLRPTMRANPTTGSFTVDGVTYYYRDANI